MGLPQKPKVLICGSRDWDDPDWIRGTVCALPKSATIIVGGARGADSIAEEAARRRGQNVIVVKADWSLGKGAGVLRNTKMLDMGPDLVIAFWKGRSSGTRDTVVKTMKRSIPLRLEWRP